MIHSPGVLSTSAQEMFMMDVFSNYSNNNNNNNDNINFQQSSNTVVTGNINVANQVEML
jgi:hypothetical protein